MSSCPHIHSCELNRSISMRAAMSVWRSFYCDGGFTRCERYKLREAGHGVPERLLPNGRILDSSEPVADERKAGGAI